MKNLIIILLLAGLAWMYFGSRAPAWGRRGLVLADRPACVLIPGPVHPFFFYHRGRR